MLRHCVIAFFITVAFLYAARADDAPENMTHCDWYLRTNTEKICMSTTQRTHPALAANLYGTTYYANLGPGNHSSIKVQYDDQVLSVYDNPDSADYELIHWLSGRDALVNGVWVDRLATTTTDVGPLNFVNHGCTWNDEHTGYFSARGDRQYFATNGKPNLNFGDDWFIEITGNWTPYPSGQKIQYVVIMDLGSIVNTGSSCATGLSGYNGYLHVNNKPINNAGPYYGQTATPFYTFNYGTNETIIFGERPYDDTLSQSFIKYKGVTYLSEEMFPTIQWYNCWGRVFYLFRGVTLQWDGESYYCTDSTIYDIKVWRKKAD